MIAYANKNLFKTESHDKTLTLAGTGISIDNNNIRKEEFEIEEVLNSSDCLNFGECNAAKIKVTVGYYETSVAGKSFWANITPDGGAALPFGRFQVISDLPTADKRWREIIAYDDLYKILKFNVAPWYNSILPDENTTMTLKQFRDSFFTIFGITQDTITLPNDSMTVKRTIETEVLTGKTVLNAICQITGCFGKMGRNGYFQYIFLSTPEAGLFPSETLYPSNNLYPKAYGFEDNPTGENGTYLSCKYEEYLTSVIDEVQIMDSENNIKGTSGAGSNPYQIRDNFLIFDKSAADLNTIASTILGKIGGIWYRPTELEMVAEPWLETGDGIRIDTVDGVGVDTYILRRKIKGIQALKDSIIADGLEQLANDNNTTSSQFTQVSGNINKVKADLIEAKTILAEEIRVERAKIDALTAIAITTENLSAQTISASQITTGTLDASLITVQNLSASSITTGIMSVSRLADAAGVASETGWYETNIVYEVYSSGSATVLDINGNPVSVSTGVASSAHHLYLLKGSAVT